MGEMQDGPNNLYREDWNGVQAGQRKGQGTPKGPVNKGMIKKM